MVMGASNKLLLVILPRMVLSFSSSGTKAQKIKRTLITRIAAQIRVVEDNPIFVHNMLINGTRIVQPICWARASNSVDRASCNDQAQIKVSVFCLKSFCQRTHFEKHFSRMTSLGSTARENAVPQSKVIEMVTIQKPAIFPKLMMTKHDANIKLPRQATPLERY